MNVLDYIMGMKAAESSGGGESNDFIITLTYNETSQMWQPDKTFAEISAAYEANKNIIVKPDDYREGEVSATLYINFRTEADIYYSVLVYTYDEGTNSEWITTYGYVQTSDEYIDNGALICYGTNDADAKPSNVARGKIFYTVTGREVGTGDVVP